MRKLLAHIRPKFLYDESDRVVAILRSPDFQSVGHILIGGRMIAVGRDKSRDCAPADFRIIELRATVVTASNQIAAGSIEGTVHEAALAKLKITGILMQDGRQDRSSHEIFDGAVGESCAVTLPITFGSLAVSRFAVFGLA